MIEFLQIIGGGIAWRIRGGMLNETARKMLGKPEGWEIPNNYIRALCAIYFAFLLPVTWATPTLIALLLLGIMPGYFGGQFDLAKIKNQNWNNYARLSVRGAFICFPALCLYLIYPSLTCGVLAGVLMPLFYRIGSILPEIKGVISHSQYGEWLIGITLAAAVIYG